MNIRPITDAERSVYNDLARQHGTLFNRLDWLILFGDKMQAFGIFDDGGTMIGGFSLYQERRLCMRIFRRAPFTPTCGPFSHVRAQNPVSILEERRKIVESMAECLDKQHPAICMLPLAQSITDVLPFVWRKYKVVPKFTYLLDLALPIEHILKNMSSIRRNDISKGVRDGLVPQRSLDMGVVRDLVLATFDRQKKYVDRDCLEAILFQYATPSNSFAFTTYRGETPVSSCFVVHDSTTAYYLLGGYNAQERHHGAGPLAVFEAIRHSQELGLQTFDFEGSVIPAIERYFRGFGGTLTPYMTVNKAWLPFEMVLKNMRRNVF